MINQGLSTLIAASGKLLGMEITPEQFARIEHCLPVQRGNVSITSGAMRWNDYS